MKLRINGGDPVRKDYFPAQLSYNSDELDSISNHLINKKVLSGYRGNASDAFYGGENVQKFENDFSKYLNSNVVAVNSCTSALQISCGAIGLEPGDEVIVTPWSMICSATAPLLYGAIPVFADIDEYFCLKPESIREKITDRTRAIIVVDLFGQPYDWEAINEIAVEHNLLVIEDAAQAIGSDYNGNKAGTLGDLGCFSFTQGKHLTCGEGGAVAVEFPYLLNRVQLLRNHIDAVTNEYETLANLENISMCGFNMRMTELQAIIMTEQLKKLDHYVKLRQQNAEKLYEKICEIPAIKKAPVRKGCTHSYYVQAFFFDNNYGIHRDKFINAVKAELQPDCERIDRGIPIVNGYIKPLYKFPVFQNNYHWTLRQHNADYKDVRLENVEKYQDDEVFISMYHGLDLSDKDLQDVADAFLKVWENKDELK